MLDLGLPDLDGAEVTRRLRVDSAVPITMLTARSSEDARVSGLRLGADDYVVKPFSPRELVARVTSVLRRAAAPTVTGYGAGALRIDVERREVTVHGHLVELTRTEFRCCDHRMNPGNVLRRRSRRRPGPRWGVPTAILRGSIGRQMTPLRLLVVWRIIQ